MEKLHGYLFITIVALVCTDIPVLGEEPSTVETEEVRNEVQTPRRATIPTNTADVMPSVAPPIPVKSKANITEYRSTPKAPKEDPFVANVRRRIAASWSTYPTCDLTARIYFEIDQSGDVVNLKVLNASGDPEGIGQAVDAIKCATPFGTPSQTERFAINFKDGQMDYSPDLQRFQTTSVQMVTPKATESIVPSTQSAPVSSEVKP